VGFIPLSPDEEAIMPETPGIIRAVDGKGRVTLGTAAAGRTVQVE
jgi:hypothetical protein